MLIALASSDKYGLNKNGLSIDADVALYIAGGKGVSMVNQILTADAFILVTSTCTHGIHKQYVNQVTHAGEEKEHYQQESSADEGETM